MKILNSGDFIENVSNVIHEDTQLHEYSVDLTVEEIHSFTGAGSLDFGGSEFESAAIEQVDTVRKNKDDKYGWWKLEGGMYRVYFNEGVEFSEDQILVLNLHEHARSAGLIASEQFLSENEGDFFLNIQVPEAGCNIKENARIAVLHVIKR